MIRTLLAICLLLLIRIEGAPTHFFHADLGSIGDDPALGAGYRLHKGYNGCDLAAKVATQIAILGGRGGTSSSIQGLYLFYPTKGGLYLGAGPGYMTDSRRMPRGGVVADGVIGYQRSDKWFLQWENSTFIKHPDYFDKRSYQSLSVGLAF